MKGPRAAAVEYWDVLTPGFGLRVLASGVRTWCVRYRKDGRKWRVTVGAASGPKALTLHTARTRGRRLLSRVAHGEHPAGDVHQERATHRATVGGLIDDYVKALPTTVRTRGEITRILAVDVRPAWGSRPASSLTRRDVRELVARKAQTAPIQANRLLAWVRRLLQWGVDEERLPANVAARLPKPAPERTRDRVLTAEERQALWAHLTGEALAVSAVMADLVQFLLVTGQRLGEAARATWGSVREEPTGWWWTIPAAHAKNGRDHRVPLTPLAVAILERRKAALLAHTDADGAPDVHVEAGDFVFSTSEGTTIYARAKKAGAALSRALDVSFRLHDLRRTVATGLAEAGVPRDHISHVLNHSAGAVRVTAIYDRYRYDREKRIALTAWDAALARQVAGEGAAVIVLPFRAS